MLDHASHTAAHVALFRALESARPTGRLFDDPYATRFLPMTYRTIAWAAHWPPARRHIERYIDERWPAGPRASAIVRTRFIDDLVQSKANPGALKARLVARDKAYGADDAAMLSRLAGEIIHHADGGAYTVARKDAGRLMDLYSFCTADVENGGHTFGSELPPEDKKALIAYLATF